MAPRALPSHTPLAAGCWLPAGGCAGHDLIDIVSSDGWPADLELVLAALLEDDCGYAEVLKALAGELAVSAAPPPGFGALAVGL